MTKKLLIALAVLYGCTGGIGGPEPEKAERKTQFQDYCSAVWEENNGRVVRYIEREGDKNEQNKQKI